MESVQKEREAGAWGTEGTRNNGGAVTEVGKARKNTLKEVDGLKNDTSTQENDMVAPDGEPQTKFLKKEGKVESLKEHTMKKDGDTTTWKNKVRKERRSARAKQKMKQQVIEVELEPRNDVNEA